MRDRSSSVCPRVCIVSLPLFTRGALWVWRCCWCCCCMFPFAAAPHRLLKTGYTANNLKWKESHPPLQKIVITCHSGTWIFLDFLPRASLCVAVARTLVWTNCSPLPPWSDWEEEPNGGGGAGCWSGQPQCAGQACMHTRIVFMWIQHKPHLLLFVGLLKKTLM